MITGVAGHIRWVRYPAAVIEGYTVKWSKTGQCSLSATVVSANAYNLRQTPLTFVAPTEHGDWCWRITTPIVGDRPPFHLTADLGDFEEIRHEPLRAPR